ncbi:substrate-binding domain-containing protein [Algibacter mikhailovii]|uniref:Transcriptional regulator n=1 Tax=Algibacter mikhailovii TaxID=425498 RepID=A0A918R3Q0_9FLAO|nr:substrate-binding domain-containing protein [Algibacter mikhailovii]GGZ86145.1 transcriptional regulator [Algibacter mikhailovii]
MLKKYTIRDIAEMAGVSKGTVDRVLHNRGKVSEIAFKKVSKILDEIDFKPNLIAKNLKNNKIYHICVLLPDPKMDSYWDPCLKGIDDVIKELGAFGINIDTFFFDPTSTKSFLNKNLMVQKIKPDAVLLVPLFFKEAIVAIEGYNELGIMVSTFNNHIESAVVKSFIGQNLFQSGRIAAKLLHSIMKGGDIAIIHIDEKYKNAIHMQEKEQGFKSYYKELAHFGHEIHVSNLKNTDFNKSIAIFLLKHPNIKGIFVTTSKGFHVADYIQNNINKNIALVCYDLLVENITYLKNGTIDFLIHQNPKQQTYLGLKCLVEYFLFDKEVPSQLLLPIDIINSENATPFMRD